MDSPLKVLYMNIALPLRLMVTSSPVLALSNASSPRHQLVMTSMTSRPRSRHHMKNLQSLTWYGFLGGYLCASSKSAYWQKVWRRI